LRIEDSLQLAAGSFNPRAPNASSTMAWPRA
jgi:hypothetical protein